EISQADYDEQISRIQKQSLLVNMIAGGLMSPSDSVLGIATSTVSPAVSYEIGQYFKKEGKEGSFEHIATHAVLGALTSAANGGNALSGAVSAGGAEYIAKVTAETLFQKDAKDLTADEKQTVSSIAQLVGVVSGSVTGDSSANAYIGNLNAQNAVDNNLLNPKHSWTDDYLTQKGNNQKTSATVSGDQEIEKNFKRAENCAINGNCSVLGNQFSEWSSIYLARAEELDAQGKHAEADEARQLAQKSAIGAGIAFSGVNEQWEIAKNNGKPNPAVDFSNWNDGRPSVWPEASSKVSDYWAVNVGGNLFGYSFGGAYMKSNYDDSHSGGFYATVNKGQIPKKLGWDFSITTGDIMTDEHGNTLTVNQRFDKTAMQKRTKEFIDGKSIATGACVAGGCGKVVNTIGKNPDGSQMKYQSVETGFSPVPFSIDFDSSVTWGSDNK
ncbi:MAG: VENN motif pre-toxin domain-containing protein, partial [Neisseriaceae bacterium]|nr:VENN motif pre-toxin domain-containing protein [Neisseriaceae bacterium]